MMIRMVCAVATLTLAPLACVAEALLALPSETGLTIWDTETKPPVARFVGLENGTAGRCYDLADNSLRPSADTIGCLSYLVQSQPLETGGADAYEITGVVSFMNEPIGDISSGFKITGVDGIDYCGERDGCDEIFILGVTSPALVGPLVTAAQNQQLVTLSGPGVWNLESIDIVIETIKD